MINQEIRKKIIKKCISLEEYCIGDLAWTKNDAVNLINDIMEDDIGILGGDICILEADHLKYPGHYWCCSPKESESPEEYYTRIEVEESQFNEKYLIQMGERIKFSSETQEEYNRRSKFESLKFIERYPVEPGENVIFALVFTDDVFLLPSEKIHDLAKSDPEVKETATVIVDNWLMCPSCQEVWENVLNYVMVRCPKCAKKLHNLKFNK